MSFRVQKMKRTFDDRASALFGTVAGGSLAAEIEALYGTSYLTRMQRLGRDAAGSADKVRSLLPVASVPFTFVSVLIPRRAASGVVSYVSGSILLFISGYA